VRENEVEAVADRIRVFYGRAYYDFDKLLKAMGLSDDQVLQAVNAIQPMLDAKADQATVGCAWFHCAPDGQTSSEFASWLEETVREIGSRYGAP
jgi:hypothetical protein